MSIHAKHCAVVGIALLLGGCAYADDLFGTNWSREHGNPTTVAMGQARSSVSSSQARATSPPTSSLTATTQTGTIVGEQAQRLRSDLSHLKSNVTQHQQDVAVARASVMRDWQAYVDTVSHLASHMKGGTTPDDPSLMAQWDNAQGSLNHVIGDVDQLSRLSNHVAADISLATFLTKTTSNAFSLQGAVDEDRRQLNEIKKELDGTRAELDALLKTVTDEITYQSENIAHGTENLTTLAQAIRTGTLFGSKRIASATRVHHAAKRRELSTARVQPFVVINFQSGNPNYVDALYTAISRALERDPAAKFNLVAVSPAAGTADEIALYSNAAKKNAEGVMQSLIKMGLPPDRLTLSATTSVGVQANEVRIYVH